MSDFIASQDPGQHPCGSRDDLTAPATAPLAGDIDSSAWSNRETASFIAQLHLQAKEQLDPAFSRFMAATAERLTLRHAKALLWDQVYQDRCEGALIEQTIVDQERKRSAELIAAQTAKIARVEEVARRLNLTADRMNESGDYAADAMGAAASMIRNALKES